MTQTPLLIEPSFAEGITVIAAASEVPEQKRRHWTTSLRQIAKMLDKPLELIPARYSAVRADLAHLHHVPAMRQDAGQSSKQRESRLALVGEREGHPRTRRTVDGRMGGAAAEGPGSPCALQALIPDAVLLGEQYRAHRGGGVRRRALHGLSLTIREACRRGIPAPARPSLELQCRQNPRLAGADSHRAGDQASGGGGVGRFSGKATTGCRLLPPWSQSRPSKPDRPTHPAFEVFHDQDAPC